MFMPNCIHTKRLGVILGIALSTIIVGCGSGDGTGRNPIAAASEICRISSGANPICGHYHSDVRESTGTAADNSPTAGNLFQTSEDNADSISATVSHSRSKLNFEVERTDDSAGTTFTVSNADQDSSVLITSTVVTPSATVTITDVLLYSESGSTAGYVDMIHDYSVSLPVTGTAPLVQDSDYMAAGVWVLRSSATSYEIGAFAGGNQPYSAQSINDLTNTATYSGEAIGLWTSASSTTEGASSLFNGKVTLTAEFGNAILPGTIEGVINEIRGIPESSTNLTITLESTAIASAGNGFFTGDTEMVFSPTVTLNGKWGGEFFGNDGTDATDYPKSTAGTFGGSDGSGANALSYVGAFLGYK